MAIRHGSPIIFLGALLGVGAGCLAFIFSANFWVALAGAILPLVACAVYANWYAVADTPPDAPSSPPSAGRPSHPFSLARFAVLYVTVAGLIIVWSGVWYFYMRSHPPRTDWAWYGCHGCLATGFLLLLIGLLADRISRSARQADLPPEKVTAAEVRSETLRASCAPGGAPVGPSTPDRR